MQGLGFRGGLVFKAHKLLYHSTLGLRVIKKKVDTTKWRVPRPAAIRCRANSAHIRQSRPDSVRGFQVNVFDRIRVGWLTGISFWEGCRESRRCSRDTYPESHITKYTSIRRLKRFEVFPLGSEAVGLRWGTPTGDAEMCSGSEEGSYLRLIDFCITQL